MPRTVEWPKGSGVFAEWGDGDLTYQAVLLTKVESGEISAEQMYREITIRHDSLLHGRFLSPSEEADTCRAYGIPTAAAAFGVAPPPDPSSAFPMPERVRRQLSLSDPALEPQEAAQEPPRATEMPLGTPGRGGGAVPPFTVERATAIFQAMRGEEFRAICRIIMSSAFDSGEFHTEVLVGLPIEQPNVIGAAINALAKKGWIEKGAPEERRISSVTSRRKSDVWRLTDEGRAEVERRRLRGA